MGTDQTIISRLVIRLSKLSHTGHDSQRDPISWGRGIGDVSLLFILLHRYLVVVYSNGRVYCGYFDIIQVVG